MEYGMCGEDMESSTDIESPYKKMLAETCAKSHRRSHSIAAGDISERLQLVKEKEVSVLQSELNKQNKALEESQQEAKLAAQIGQSLLLKTQEMDEQIEHTHSELQNKLHESQSDAQLFKVKFQEALRQKQILENDLSLASEELEKALEAVADERTLADENKEMIHYFKNENLTLQRNVESAAQRLESAEEGYANVQRVCRDLTQEVNNLNAECNALRSQIRVQEEKIASLTHRADTAEFKEAALKTKFNNSHQNPQQEENTHLKQNMQKLEGELEDSYTINKELEEKNVKLLHMLKESKAIAKGLRKNIDELQFSQQLEQVAETGSSESTPTSSPSPEKTNEVAEMPRKGSLLLEISSPVLPRKGSLFMELSQSLSSPVKSVQPVKSAKIAPLPKAQTIHKDKTEAEVDILQEYFVLTATAIKMNGAGLENDYCNLSNIELYEEAKKANITFENFHRWIRLRLRGKPYTPKRRSIQF